MKKAAVLFVFAMLAAGQSFARYIVVLKDGTRYAAKQKWTLKNGKALITLESGQTMQVDPALIDEPKSEQMTKIGMSNANVLEMTPVTPTQTAAPQPSLGSQIKLRKNPTPDAVTAAPKPAAPATAPGALPPRVLEKFETAYDNVSIYERKIESTGARSLRAELVADTEERVFNAISATAFLIVRNAGVEGTQIDVVELFMKTTMGGSAGRFHMTRADAEALNKGTMSQQDYFIRHVIY
jgi:hypothetical protein